MKFSFVFILSLMFLISCGDNDDDNRFVNGINQACGVNTINGYNNFNNFNNGYGYGYYSPYQLEMARRCGYAINNGIGFNNGINGCYVPADLQHLADYDYIDAQMIDDMTYGLETELRDVHGIVQPQSEADAEAYYTQVGFSAGVYTGGGYGWGGYPYGGGWGANPYGFCDQLSL